MTWLIQHDLDFERAKNEIELKRAPYADAGFSHTFLQEMPSPRVFHSHLHCDHLPENLNKKAKIIYVMRNPKDIVVSYYFYAKSVPGDEFEGTIEDMFNSFVTGQFIYGPWHEHVNEYTQMDNVYLIHFEDLLEARRDIYRFKRLYRG